MQQLRTKSEVISGRKQKGKNVCHKAFFYCSCFVPATVFLLSFREINYTPVFAVKKRGAGKLTL